MAERNDDWLDRLLREDARAPLDDAGFTRGVMASLPFSGAPYPWLKTVLVVGSTALGGILAVALAPIGSLVIDGVTQIAHFRAITPGVTATLALTVVFAVCAYVLATDE